LSDVEFLAVHTETTGSDPLTDSVRLLGLAAPGTRAFLIDVIRIPEADRIGLAHLLASPVPKTFHNAKRDLTFLLRSGLPVGGPVFDTMVAEQLLLGGKEGRTTIAAITRTHLQHPIARDHLPSDWTPPTLSPWQLESAAQDVSQLLELRSVLIECLRAADLVEVARLEFSFLPAVVELEMSGILIDGDRWDRLTRHLESDLRTIEAQVRTDLPPGININSSSQLLIALRELGLNIMNTSEETLVSQKDRHRVVDDLLRYRRVAKRLSSFGTTYRGCVHPLTGRIHAKYHQIGAITGRMSCSEPNLQQVPHDPEIRSCFIAAPGKCFVIADYSQIELRVMAQLSQDSRMLEAYRKGEDLHRLTASLITGTSIEMVTEEQRQAAKAVNFGLLYAMGAKTLREYAMSRYGVTLSMKEASAFRKAFFDVYPGVAAWHHRMKGQRETRTLAGRLRRWTEDRPKLTEVLNAPVQGTAADILKRALAELLPRLRPLGANIVAVVHDEVIVEVAEELAGEAERIVRDTMESAGAAYLPDLPVVVEAKIARDWS
jgi:DNA polymerase-1